MMSETALRGTEICIMLAASLVVSTFYAVGCGRPAGTGIGPTVIAEVESDADSRMYRIGRGQTSDDEYARLESDVRASPTPVIVRLGIEPSHSDDSRQDRALGSRTTSAREYRLQINSGVAVVTMHESGGESFDLITGGSHQVDGVRELMLNQIAGHIEYLVKTE